MQHAVELNKTLNDLEGDIRRLADEPSLNVNSARQLGEVLKGFPYNQMHHYVEKITACYGVYTRLYGTP